MLEGYIEEEQKRAAMAPAIAATVAAEVASVGLAFPEASVATQREAKEPLAPYQECPPYKSKSSSCSFMAAGGSNSEAACKSPEAASKLEAARRVAAETEEQWRAVELLGEQLTNLKASLQAEEQVRARTAAQQAAEQAEMQRLGTASGSFSGN